MLAPNPVSAANSCGKAEPIEFDKETVAEIAVVVVIAAARTVKTANSQLRSRFAGYFNL